MRQIEQKCAGTRLILKAGRSSVTAAERQSPKLSLLMLRELISRRLIQRRWEFRTLKARSRPSITFHSTMNLRLMVVRWYQHRILRAFLALRAIHALLRGAGKTQRRLTALVKLLCLLLRCIQRRSAAHRPCSPGLGQSLLSRTHINSTTHPSASADDFRRSNVKDFASRPSRSFSTAFLA